MIIYFLDEILGLKIADDFFTRLQTVQSMINGLWEVNGSARAENIDRFKSMTVTDLIVVEIMGWRDF